jgi:hypothetical protein
LRISIYQLDIPKTEGSSGTGRARDGAAQSTIVSKLCLPGLPAHYLSSFRQPLTFAAFAKDDPLPGLVELPLVAARTLSRSMALPRRAAQKAPTGATPADRMIQVRRGEAVGQ